MSRARTLPLPALALPPRRLAAALALPTTGAVLRLAAAVGLCVALLPLWRASGLDALYRAAILEAAQGLVQGLGILPASRRLAPAIVDRVTLEPVVLFVLSLGLVASRLGAGARVRRYGLLLLAFAAVNVLCVLLEAAIAAGSPTFVREGRSLVVPVPFVVMDRLRFVLYHIGLQLWPFAAMALTVHWNARRDR